MTRKSNILMYIEKIGNINTNFIKKYYKLYFVIIAIMVIFLYFEWYFWEIIIGSSFIVFYVEYFYTNLKNQNI